MISIPLARAGTKKRIFWDNACAKAYEKLVDPNVYFRCSGAKELIELGKAGVLKKGSIDEEIRQSIYYAAFGYQDDTDPDVVRFSCEILLLMGSKTDPNGRFMKIQMGDDKKRTQKVQANIKQCLMDGQPAYRTRNPWRAALARSLRENRTLPCKSMELVSLRSNHTKINRVVNFRGFVLDQKGAAKDRLYTIVDSRVEKAEQIDPMIELDAVLLWRFKATGEHYTITGRLKTIRDYKGHCRFTQDDPVKVCDAPLDDAEVQFRKIAWNICSDQESDMFQYPNRHDDQ